MCVSAAAYCWICCSQSWFYPFSWCVGMASLCGDWRPWPPFHVHTGHWHVFGEAHSYLLLIFLKSKIIPYCLLACAWLIFQKPEFYHPCQECGGQKTAVGISASYRVGIKLSCQAWWQVYLLSYVTLPKLILGFPFAMCFDRRLITRIFSLQIARSFYLGFSCCQKIEYF